MNIDVVLDGWINNIIGDPLLASILVVMFLVVLGVKMNWSMDMFAVILIPTMAIMVFLIGLPQWVFLLLMIASAIIIAMAVLRTLYK